MKHKVFILLGLMIHIIILTQSLLPASLSSEQSGLIVDVIYPFILNLGIQIDVQTFSLIIRKTAHFTEFFFLGLFWYLVYIRYFKGIKLMGVVLIHGLLTAILDETVQLFVDGRSGEVLDVLIDFSGVLVSVLIMTFFIRRKRHQLN